MLEVKNIPPRQMYVMFDMVFNHQNIYYFENTVSYPEILVDLIEKIDSNPLSHEAISKWGDWTASDDKSFIIGSGKHINSSKKNTNTGDDFLNKQILYVINSLMMSPEMTANRFYDTQIIYHKKMKSNYVPEKPNINSQYINLYKYNEGQGMGPHCDAEDPTGTGTNLKYSMVTYLNDDYEGGEIYFKNQDVKIKPKAGSLVLFPSTAPYVHESLPVTKGSKIMYTTHWLK